MSNRIVLGRVAGAHALRGQIRVRVLGDGPDNLLSRSGVWLASTPEASDADFYEVHATGTGRAGEVRLALEGISDRDTAQALRGLFVLVEQSELEPLGEDEYYWHELVGCRVETDAGQVVGTVREIWESGAHDVLVVENEAGRRNLIPTARELMTEVDRGERRIVVKAIPGLLDLD